MLLHPVLVRNALRYAAGGLVAASIVTPDTAQTIAADPLLNGWATAALGVVIGGVTEFAYAKARKFGWRT